MISPEVRLTPTPGHTPGHVSVLIESEGERAVITGDMMHHPCQLAHPEWRPPTATRPPAPPAAPRRRRGRHALVIGTHFAAPTAGHVVRDGAAFRFAV